MLPEWECDGAAGVSIPDVICEPYPCPTPCACCLADGVCEMHTLDECPTLGGEFMGAQTVCDPNPCGSTAGLPDDPAAKTTWGKV